MAPQPHESKNMSTKGKNRIRWLIIRYRTRARRKVTTMKNRDGRDKSWETGNGGTCNRRFDDISWYRQYARWRNSSRRTDNRGIGNRRFGDKRWYRRNARQSDSSQRTGNRRTGNLRRCRWSIGQGDGSRSINRRKWTRSWHTDDVCIRSSWKRKRTPVRKWSERRNPRFALDSITSTFAAVVSEFQIESQKIE